jgi:acyl dehydratase
MPLNPDFVGRSYPAGETYLVSRERIRAFADAIGDPNPAYRDIAASQALGHADIVAPPTFAIVLALQASTQVAHDSELGLDYTRVVHGEQRFAHVRPIVAGDELVAVTTVESIREAAGNDMITTRVDISTSAGEPVCTAHSLLVSRGAQA